MQRPLDTCEMRIWRGVLEVSARLFPLLDDELRRDHGFGLADYEVLAVLSEAPEERMRMTELGARSSISASRLTYRVDRLEERGWVRRVPCETDRRGWYAELTADGRAAIEEAYPTHLAGVRRHLIDRVRPEELAVVADALERVREELDAPPDGA